MSRSASIVKALRRKKLDVSLLSDDDSPCVVNSRLATGCLVLDHILGGGLPVGRMTEIYGDPSSGKSLIASQVAAIAQQHGVLVGYADSETAVSLDIMEMVGVDIDELIYTSPDTVEEIFTFFEELIVAKQPEEELLLVWDSISASSTKREMENEYGKANMGQQAQLISQGLRKITRLFSKANVSVLFLNQIRQKIGVMYGDNETTSGGNAVSFYASVRVKLDSSKKIKLVRPGRKDKVIGMESIATVTKNKVAMPFRSAVLPVYFGHGIDDALSTFMYLKDSGNIVLAGQKYTLLLGEDEIEFKKKDWEDLYEQYYAEVSKVVSETE